MLTWIHFLIFALASLQTPPPAWPIAQVRISLPEPLGIYEQAAPPADALPLGRARWGEVILIYEQVGDWGRSKIGWLNLQGLILEPAVVQYQATYEGDLILGPGLSLPAGEVAGVLALFEGQALVYSRLGAAWVAADLLELSEPGPDLRDFVERSAYVRVLSAALYADPDEASPPLAEIDLGRQVSLVYQDQDWALVRGPGVYGWSRLENFDPALLAQGRGQMNAGPVNLRRRPVDGDVVNVVDFQASVLILGRNAARDWLYIRTEAGLEGWVAAEFVDYEGNLRRLPLIRIED